MRVEFTENGDLRITGADNLECFALKQWDKLRRAGKAKIIISDDPVFDVAEEMKKMGDELKEFQRWRKNAKATGEQP